MTRNLIAAKVWQSGRKNVCQKCAYFENAGENIAAYDWQKCQKQTDKKDCSIDRSGDKCLSFKPR